MATISQKPPNKQLPLFDIEAVPTQPKKARPTRWYYITRWRKQEMLHYISKDGTAVWCENDCRHVTPQLYTSIKVAKGDMKKYKGNDVCRFYGK